MTASIIQKNKIDPRKINTSKAAKGKLARCQHKKGRPAYGTELEDYKEKMFGKHSMYNIRGGK